MDGGSFHYLAFVSFDLSKTISTPTARITRGIVEVLEFFSATFVP